MLYIAIIVKHASRPTPSCNNFRNHMVATYVESLVSQLHAVRSRHKMMIKVLALRRTGASSRNIGKISFQDQVVYFERTFIIILYHGTCYSALAK